MNELPLNQILCGDCAELMQGFPENSIDLVVTSPPYWGLRDYGEETVKVWGGTPECEHEWGESLPAAKSGHKNIGFAERSQQNYSGGGHKIVTIAEKHCPSEAGQFCSKCGAWCGSLGLEPHPQLFIDHLVEICREIKRVLKPSGTFWLNLGDSYASMKGKCYNPGGGATSLPQDAFKELTREQNPNRMLKSDGGWLQPKQLLMIPARVAIALQHDGWILRNDIIWHKPNHMPSSVKDRLTCAYEHVFLFAKARRYYFDLDAIRQPQSASTIQRITQPNVMNQPGGDKQRELRGEGGGNASRSADMVKSLARNYEDWYFSERDKKSWHDHEHDKTMGFGQQKRGFKVKNIPHPRGKNPGDIWEIDAANTGSRNKPPYKQNNPHLARITEGREAGHSKGKNPGDLWRIPTTPFPGAHFAVFPPALIEPIIKAGSPRWICSKCGKPRERIVEKIRYIEHPQREGRNVKAVQFSKEENKYVSGGTLGLIAQEETVGLSDCGCEADWVGGIVLDPFAGSGTALRVARKLGRGFIGIEINPEYAEMCERRVRSDTYKPPPEGVQPLTEIFEN